jgi:hypothetical protein
MKRILRVFVLLACVPAFALGQATQRQVSQPDTKLTQELMALLQSWQEARKRGDTEVMSRLMAEEWTALNDAGVIITRERSLAAAKAGNWKDRPISTKDNATARLYGETAVLTFRSKTETGHTQHLYVYVKRQGRWLWVAGQSTKLAEQQPQ